MKKFDPRTLLAAAVFGVAAPMAFAQTAPAQQPAQPTQAPAPQQGAAPQQQSWNDVDADQNGTLSQQEVTAVPALAEVFSEADTDGDGELTTDEYQAFVQKAQAAAAGAQQPPTE